MLNKKIQRIYLSLGAISLFLSLTVITIVPVLMQFVFKNGCFRIFFSAAELFLLILCSVFYLFSQRYYAFQLCSFGFAFLLFYLFKGLFVLFCV